MKKLCKNLKFLQAHRPTKFPLPFTFLTEQQCVRTTMVIPWLWIPGSWFPDQGSSPDLLQWKCRVLTTGAPGKSSTAPWAQHIQRTEWSYFACAIPDKYVSSAMFSASSEADSLIAHVLAVRKADPVYLLRLVQGCLSIWKYI